VEVELTAIEKLHAGVKVVILGEAATGKTTSLMRLHSNAFISYHDATIGTSFLIEQLIIEDTPIKLSIWDTAGSERYHSLVPMYYRGAAAAIVMYSITDDESFLRAEKWVSELENLVSPKPIIALAGNKLDLAENGRQIVTEKAAKFAKEHDLIFFETSAKTGENVKKLFVTIAKKLLENAREEELRSVSDRIVNSNNQRS